MNNKFIDSTNIQVFPCANRKVNIESKLNTEFNFTHIPSVAGLNDCILNTDYDGKCEFILGGYYFRINNSEIYNSSSPVNENVYAVIAITEKTLISDDNSTSGETTWILADLTDASVPQIPTNSLDVNDSFRGLILTSSTSTFISNINYKYKILQLRQTGTSTSDWVNRGPLLEGTELNDLTLSGSTISNVTKLNGLTLSNSTEISGVTKLTMTSGEISGLTSITIDNLTVNTATILNNTLNGSHISKDGSNNKLVLGDTTNPVGSITTDNLTVNTATILNGTLNGTSIGTDPNNDNKLILGGTGSRVSKAYLNEVDILGSLNGSIITKVLYGKDELALGGTNGSSSSTNNNRPVNTLNVRIINLIV